MTVKKWLSTSIEKLRSSSIPSANLDAEVLLADALGKDRSWLHAHPDFTLQGPTLQQLDEQIDRRMAHEPLAYIRGKQEFFGREFKVSPDTLTPRPETETMIEILQEIKPKKIVDIGTGSGCIAITAKLELPNSDVVASDISDKCLEVTKNNALELNANIKLLKSDLMQDLPVAYIAGALICCNLPYVPVNFSINTAASHEPKLAIFGGDDGLDYYRELFEEIISLPKSKKPVAVLTESLPTQHETLQSIAEIADFKLTETRDFIQYFVSFQSVQ